MSGKFILLVEDNPDDAELALRAFRKSRIVNEIVLAQDGAEALNFLLGTGSYAGRDISDLPAVILLDLKLPKIDGFELLQRIRASEQIGLIPVVILTSSNEEQDLVRGYQLGANSYICKSVDFDQFADTIKQLGIYWLFLNTSPPHFIERRSR